MQNYFFILTVTILIDFLSCFLQLKKMLECLANIIIIRVTSIVRTANQPSQQLKLTPVFSALFTKWAYVNLGACWL